MLMMLTSKFIWFRGKIFVMMSCMKFLKHSKWNRLQICTYAHGPQAIRMYMQNTSISFVMQAHDQSCINTRCICECLCVASDFLCFPESRFESFKCVIKFGKKGRNSTGFISIFQPTRIYSLSLSLKARKSFNPWKRVMRSKVTLMFRFTVSKVCGFSLYISCYFSFVFFSFLWIFSGLKKGHRIFNTYYSSDCIKISSCIEWSHVKTLLTNCCE